MSRFLAVASALFLATSAGAYAQGNPAATVVPGSLSVSGCPGGYTPCFVPYSATNPLPTTSSGGGSTVVTNAGTFAVQDNGTAITAVAASVASTGAAAPAKAMQQGVVSSGNLVGVIGCDASAVYDASTNGSTQLVALSSSKIVYVCGYTIVAAGTVNVELDYGTGSACATGNTKIVPAYQLTAQAGVSDQSSVYRGLKTAASNALCIKTSAGVAVQAIVYYTQF